MRERKQVSMIKKYRRLRGLAAEQRTFNPLRSVRLRSGA